MNISQSLILIIISQIIIQIGLTIRKNIVETNKLKRINKLKELENNKINAIGDYEKKSSFWSYFKRKNNDS